MALKDKQNRTIVLPISEAEYDIFLTNNTIAHEVIQSLYDQHPELFPLQMANGYCLNGRDRMSKKMDIQLRKIEISGVLLHESILFRIKLIHATTPL